MLSSKLQVSASYADRPLLFDSFSATEDTSIAAHNAETGHVWTANSGTIKTYSHRAVVTSTPAISTTDISKSDFSAIVTIRIPNIFNAYASFIFRFADVNNYWIAHIDNNTNTFFIYKIQSGTFTIMAQASVSIDEYTDYKVEVSCYGNNISARLNNGNTISTSSSFNSTATKVGIRANIAGTNFDDLYCAISPGRNFVSQRTLPNPTSKLGIVLDLGLSGSYDTVYVCRPHFLEMNSSIGRYHLYYTGNTTNSVAPGDATAKVCLAYSNDGLTWTKWGKVTTSGLDITGEIDFFVMRDNGTTVAYMSNTSTQIARRVATNSDATQFGTRSNVLTVGSAGAWDSLQLRYPSVIKVNNTYYLYYMGYNGSHWQIGLATSPDGINFTKHPANPILRPTTCMWWEDGEIFDPHVFYRNGKFYMGYTGATSNRRNPPLAQPYWEQLGLAYSTDGENWLRDIHNPWLKWGGTGSVDDVHTIDFEIIDLEGSLYAIYTAHDANDKRRIAMAAINVPLP